MHSLEGGCLCGAIRYAIRLETPEGYYCHCRMCQLAFGSVFAPWVHVPVSQVQWLRGSPKLYASSAIAERGFCPNCGTPLSFHYLDSAEMDVSVGSLDEPARIRPMAHFGTESRIEAWHSPDGLPEQRLDEHARTMARWRAAYGPDAKPGPQRPPV